MSDKIKSAAKVTMKSIEKMIRKIVREEMTLLLHEMAEAIEEKSQLLVNPVGYDSISGVSGGTMTNLDDDAPSWLRDTGSED
jgi:hypothetical protein